MKSDNYYLGELEDKLLETVNDYVHKVPRPFGILLSGGLDSGLLAAITRPDYVYTIRFTEYSKYDESRYADSIIKHLGILERTTFITPTREDFSANFQEAVRAMGEPVSHFSLVPLYIVFDLISRTRGKDANILSGEGPDEYLGGYARQIIFDELNKLYEIPELRSYHGLIGRVLGISQQTKRDLLRKYFDLVYPTVDEGVFLNFCHHALNDYPLQGQIGKMDMTLGVIEKMEQRLASYHGVKLHYPYINDAFAEHCYQLPDHLKIRNGVTKWAMRQICKKYLPEDVVNRTKMGGPVAPVNRWIDNVKSGEYDKTKYIQMQKEVLA